MYKKLYEQKIGPNAYYSLEDGMALVQEGFFAFHVELGPAYNYVFQKFTNHEICNLQTIEGYIHVNFYFQFQKQILLFILFFF